MIHGLGESMIYPQYIYICIYIYVYIYIFITCYIYICMYIYILSYYVILGNQCNSLHSSANRGRSQPLLLGHPCRTRDRVRCRGPAGEGS